MNWQEQAEITPALALLAGAKACGCGACVGGARWIAKISMMN
jgi:hypothetical protein